MREVKLDNTEIKGINRNSIYQLILENEGITRQEIATQLKLSLPTTIQNIKNLQAEGLIKEIGALSSTGGRKAKTLSCIYDAKVAVGVEITMTHIAIVLVDLSGELLASERIQKKYANNIAYGKYLADLIEKFIKTNTISDARMLGVGISIPGIISNDGKTICDSHALNYYNCSSIPEFLSNIRRKWTMINDANAAGMTELWRSRSRNTALYINLSNYVGGAILYESSIYKGDNQRSGEFGHATLVLDGRRCYCGKKGCMDPYCSAKVLSSHTNGNLSEFFIKLEEKEPLIVSVWDEYLHYLSIAVNNLRIIFDCDIILGGYVGTYITQEHLNDLRNRVLARNTLDTVAGFVVRCRYKKEPSAVGATLLYISKYIEQI